MLKYEDVSVHPIKGKKFVVNKAFTYGKYKIPKGYETNGADIPRILWCVIPPYESDRFPAVVVHDYAMATAKTYEDVINADEAFRQAMEDLGSNKFINAVMYYACSWWHDIKYGLLNFKVN